MGHGRDVDYSEETGMAAGVLVAVTISIFVALFLAVFLPLISVEHWRAAQEKARARRLADARMNARLLRFDI